MVRWRIVWLVSRREMRERVRTKVFLLTTVLMLAGAVLAGVLPVYLDGGDEDPVAVGIVGSPSPGLEAALRVATESTPAGVRVVEVPSLAEGDAALRDGDLDLVLEGTTAIRARGEGTSGRAGDLAALLARTIPVRAALHAAGIHPEEADRVLAAPALPITDVEPPKGDQDSREAVFLGGLILYMALVAYGSWVATGVLEEKASRVVEVILAAIRPSELLAGKVLGIGLLGLGQLVVVGGAGLAAATAAGADVPSSAPAAVGLVVLWFTLGFALYSCAFAALGAAASRHEDAQSAMSPLIALLVAGYVLSTTVQGDPDGLVARAGSFLPPLAPLTVPARMLLGGAPLWELAVAVGLNLACSYGLVRLGARAYGGAVLRFGPKLSIRELVQGGSRRGRRPVPRRA